MLLLHLQIHIKTVPAILKNKIQQSIGVEVPNRDATFSAVIGGVVSKVLRGLKCAIAIT
jgi:hypothetical protein